MKSKSLNFSSLRGANIDRIPLFKNANGERSHTEDDGSDWSNAQWVMALTGEVGELANVLKKIDRGDYTLEDVQQEVANELADIMTYLDILAYRLNVDLGKATMDKFNEVSERVNADVKLYEDRWLTKGKVKIG